MNILIEHFLGESEAKQALCFDGLHELCEIRVGVGFKQTLFKEDGG